VRNPDLHNFYGSFPCLIYGYVSERRLSVCYDAITLSVDPSRNFFLFLFGPTTPPTRSLEEYFGFKATTVYDAKVALFSPTPFVSFVRQRGRLCTQWMDPIALGDTGPGLPHRAVSESWYLLLLLLRPSFQLSPIQEV